VTIWLWGQKGLVSKGDANSVKEPSLLHGIEPTFIIPLFAKEAIGLISLLFYKCIRSFSGKCYSWRIVMARFGRPTCAIVCYVIYHTLVVRLKLDGLMFQLGQNVCCAVWKCQGHCHLLHFCLMFVLWSDIYNVWICLYRKFFLISIHVHIVFKGRLVIIVLCWILTIGVSRSQRRGIVFARMKFNIGE